MPSPYRSDSSCANDLNPEKTHTSPMHARPYSQTRSSTPIENGASPLHDVGLASPPRLLLEDGVALLAQGDPDPEPSHHLDEHEGEEKAVLEAVAAPASGEVGRVVRARVGEVAARRGRAVDGRRGAEEEDVGDEA